MKPTTLSLLCDSTVSCALNFCFLFMYFILLKSKEKDHIRKNINWKKMFISKITIIILISQKLGSVGPVQQKVK